MTLQRNAIISMIFVTRVAAVLGGDYPHLSANTEYIKVQEVPVLFARGQDLHGPDIKEVF
jgi:hypothetical protein